MSLYGWKRSLAAAATSRQLALNSDRAIKLLLKAVQDHDEHGVRTAVELAPLACAGSYDALPEWAKSVLSTEIDRRKADTKAAKYAKTVAKGVQPCKIIP